MELIYEGKTKNVYKLTDGNVLLKFKDDVTGKDGVFDPGANTIGLTVEGSGKSGLKMSQYFFKKVIKEGIPTHFIEANLEDVTMKVQDAAMFGNGLEVICRYRAVGSFYRRYGAYCEEGQKLDGFVEVTLKDDDRNDPPISKDALVELGVLHEEEYDLLQQLTRKVSNLIQSILAEKELELYDIKLEFGRNKGTNEILLIDEISGGNMRVYDKNGEYIAPMNLEKMVLA